MYNALCALWHFTSAFSYRHRIESKSGSFQIIFSFSYRFPFRFILWTEKHEVAWIWNLNTLWHFQLYNDSVKPVIKKKSTWVVEALFVYKLWIVASTWTNLVKIIVFCAIILSPNLIIARTLSFPNTIQMFQKI